MGGEAGMGQANSTITLYTLQEKQVIESLLGMGTVFCREEFVRHKYEEIAPIFLTAYRWLAHEGQALVSKPQKADLFYWAFHKKSNIERFADHGILELAIPLDEAIFFSLLDWNRILQLGFLSEDKKEQEAFRLELVSYGLQNETDIMLSNFYPDLKRRIIQSWSTLFRHHQEIKQGNMPYDFPLQAALWQLRREWLVNIEAC